MTTELVLLESQHPSAAVLHGIDFSDWLNTGDTIASVTVTAVSGLDVGDGSPYPAPAISDDNIVTFYLSGGTSGSTYNGSVAVVTTASDRDVVEFQISIIDPTG